jgi:hypothetical protein
MSKDDTYVAILLEVMNTKFDGVVEAVGQLQDTVKTLATKEHLARVETKVDVIEKAVAVTNVDIKDLDRRVTVLEKAA